eukprot:TRINITY_DN7199_c0_g1_i1.p1 TRINITY_DN7199_c0_g1~~TRINITY_DN7199_c0_g1_i1.p1  ORF type:complete len:407 (-),score=44.20 TRINITY_DN7199_c0_g1_i1:684-1904(-)
MPVTVTLRTDPFTLQLFPSLPSLRYTSTALRRPNTIRITSFAAETNSIFGRSFDTANREVPSDSHMELQSCSSNGKPAKGKKVSVYWDLDNKPPKVRPYDAAMAVRQMAQKFGDVVDLAAYANRHAFTHVPEWIIESRRERRRLDFLENKGLVVPSHPYVCSVCGRKCKTNLDLKKHFKQLHARERAKRMARLNSLKGKRKAKFKEQIRQKEEKYIDAAQNLIYPKTGYGLANQLRRAGVFVKTVKDKPQAADAVLKTQIQHSIARGVNILCLISDDSDFSETLKKARSSMRTVVLGDSRALQRYADCWLSWDRVTAGFAWDEINAIARKWCLEEGIMDEISELEDQEEEEPSQLDFAEINRLADRISDDILNIDGPEQHFQSNSDFSDEESDDDYGLEEGDSYIP